MRREREEGGEEDERVSLVPCELSEWCGLEGGIDYFFYQTLATPTKGLLKSASV